MNTSFGGLKEHGPQRSLYFIFLAVSVSLWEGSGLGGLNFLDEKCVTCKGLRGFRRLIPCPPLLYLMVACDLSTAPVMSA